jgi:hypothetical protein
MDHPESQGSQAMEPSVGDLLRLRQFQDGLEKCGEAELREICKTMAYQVFVCHPGVVRWLTREAVNGLGNARRQWVGETLVQKLKRDAGLPLGVPADDGLSRLEPDDQGPLADEPEQQPWQE